MSIPPKDGPPTGNYCVRRRRDTEEERADAQRTLANNGCRSFRFERLEDGSLIAHGYLVAGIVFEEFEQ